MSLSNNLVSAVTSRALLMMDVAAINRSAGSLLISVSKRVDNSAISGEICTTEILRD